jgi:hypothetical protein
MVDLAIITAIVARDRVAEQFAGPAVTTAASRALVRAPPYVACGRSPITSSPRRATRRSPDGPSA